MLIDDLEFMLPYEQNFSELDVEIKGGSAFANSSATTGRNGGGVFANSSALAGGDRSQTSATSAATFVAQGFYTAGYSVAYGAGFGADSSGAFVSDYDYSLTVV